MRTEADKAYLNKMKKAWKKMRREGIGDEAYKAINAATQRELRAKNGISETRLRPAQMDEEELTEYRVKKAETMRKLRAKKKAAEPNQRSHPSLSIQRRRKH